MLPQPRNMTGENVASISATSNLVPNQPPTGAANGKRPGVPGSNKKDRYPGKCRCPPSPTSLRPAKPSKAHPRHDGVGKSPHNRVGEQVTDKQNRMKITDV